MRTGFAVPERRKVDIYAIAKMVREPFLKSSDPRTLVPIGWVLESLHLLLDDFVLEVLDEDEMGHDHGQTLPDKRIIRLRKDVYEGMCRGVGRDRFTAAHELGHLFLHQGIVLARRWEEGSRTIANSEWQADTFASAFLIDEFKLGNCTSVPDVQRAFGVSEAAARARFNK